MKKKACKEEKKPVKKADKLSGKNHVKKKKGKKA